MSATQQGIFALLKSAVTCQPQQLPESFDLASAEQLIRKHHMVPLIYAGAVQCGISRQLPVMRSFFRSYCKALQASERQMMALNRLLEAFEENGIDYMPLKGSRLKALYSAPELRTMGDADILIRMEQYEKIRPVLISLGFAEKNETDHELVWESEELFLELHKRLIPSYNQDFYAYFGDGWQLAKRTSGSKYTMAPEDEWIYLFTHFAKHFRDGGIGCRHVVDLWVFRRENPNLDEGYIRTELEKLELQDFYENVVSLVATWFDGAVSNAKVDFMTEYILNSGSWGAMETRVVSRVIRDTARVEGTFRGKIVYVLQTAFPSLEMLRGKYRILRKYPWLLPAVWLLRPFYKILFEFRSLDRQKREMAAIRTARLQEQRKAMQIVGLRK